jgi:hypothetical protein
MNDLKSLQSRLRESQMRLREVRTENGELKIQYRRWLYTAVSLSMASMVICVAMMIFDSDPLTDLNSPNEPQGTATVEGNDTAPEPNPFEPEDPAFALEGSNPEDEVEPDTERSSLDLEMPGWDEPADPKPETKTPPKEKPTFSIPKSNPKNTNPTPPPASGGFQLPGSSSSEKRVITHRVEKYDTLWEILKRYQSSPPTPRLIRKVIKDNGLTSSRIQPGSELIIILDGR